MRTDRELLKVVINNFYRFKTIYNSFGLCDYFYYLCRDNVISFEEMNQLNFLICQNINNSFGLNYILSFFKPNYRNINVGYYFWKPGLKKPRLRYLKYLLKTVK
jgi:hypothetical protein